MTAKNIDNRFKALKACVLVPTYNNDQTLEQVLSDILEYTSDVLVVNDGATDGTKEILSKFNDIHQVHFDVNKGKGTALFEGFKEALKLGYDYAISIDSDAQHKASDLPIFIEHIEANPETLFVGARNMTQENVPGKSNFGYKMSNFWYTVASGVDLPDTQSGYRAYPIARMKDLKLKTNRFEFEVEVLVKAAWDDIPVSHLPIDVYYPPQEERVSHFRTITDFTRITIANIFFVARGLLIERPKLFFKIFKKKSLKDNFKKYVYNSSESNSRLALSVLLGVFLGIAPFWGFQMILIAFFGVRLKLNVAIGLLAGQVSIPPFIPFIIYGSYKIGGVFFSNATEINFSNNITPAIIAENFLQYAIGAFILAAIASVVLGAITYFILLLFRPNNAIKVNDSMSE